VLAVVDAADAGDPRARRLREDLVRGVTGAVRLLVLTTDVDVVALGGGVASLGTRLLDPVRAALAASARSSPFLGSLRLDERVVLVPSGVAVGALGAALSAPQRPALGVVSARRGGADARC
jgi:predicted NBD/HSP70 family sugar kinase